MVLQKTNNRARAEAQFTPLPPAVLNGSCADQVIRDTVTQEGAFLQTQHFTTQVSGFHGLGVATAADPPHHHHQPISLQQEAPSATSLPLSPGRAALQGHDGSSLS